MPPVTGSPGWTAARLEAFRAFHRARRAGLDGPHGEVTLAVVADDAVVGSARLARKPHLGEASLETGMWLADTARGRGLGTKTLKALLEEAGRYGATSVVADTTSSNRAALGVLRSCGAVLEAGEVDGRIRAELATIPQQERGT